MRKGAAQAAGLVLLGSLGVHSSSALMLGLFASLGSGRASAMRLALAALLLVMIFRPRLRRRAPAEWLQILLFGVSIAAMNAFVLLAIERIPFGVAVTINYLGPCAVAVLSSRGVREGGFALLAFLGVALAVGVTAPGDPVGLLFACLAAIGSAGYVLLAVRLGKRDDGPQLIAIAAIAAAAVHLPWLGAVHDVALPEWGLLLLAAAAGPALASVVDITAGRLTSAKVIGVLFSFGPVVGTLIGVIWLRQPLAFAAWLGIALVVVAGAGIVLSARTGTPLSS